MSQSTAKRIVYVLQRFPGRTDTFIQREIDALRQSGLDVHVVSVWQPGDAQTTPEAMERWQSLTRFALPRKPGAVVTRILGQVARSPKQSVKAAKLALKTRAPGAKAALKQLAYLAEAAVLADDLKELGAAHLHNHFGDASGTVTMLASVLCDIPYSISYHGPHIFFNPGTVALPDKVERAAFSRVISSYCKSQLILYSGVQQEDSYEIVHCGIDPEEFQYRPPTPKSADRAFKLFCAARLSPEKGHIFLLQALNKLHTQHPTQRWELSLAGDGETREALEVFAKANGMQDRVTFLGHVSSDVVREELRSSDLFVLPSFAEGVPVSLMEAMAMGVPVLATAIDGVGELIQHEVSGYLVNAADANALAEAIERVSSDDDFRISLAQKAREKVVKDFDIARETEKLRERFAGLVPQRS